MEETKLWKNGYIFSFLFHLFSWNKKKKKRKKQLTHGSICVNDGWQNHKIILYVVWFWCLWYTSKWNKTYHGISQGTLFSINHHVASNVDCNSYKCTFVVHIGKKQMNVKVTIVLVSYSPGSFFWDQINFNWAHKCERMPFNQCQRPNKHTWNASLSWAHNQITLSLVKYY